MAIKQTKVIMSKELAELTGGKLNQHGDALDLYCLEDAVLAVGTPRVIRTGVSVEIPDGYTGLVIGRSGLNATTGINILIGVIDKDYKGEIAVIANYGGNTPLAEFKKGKRIAQLLIVASASKFVVEGGEIEDRKNAREDNGFGSTGM